MKRNRQQVPVARVLLVFATLWAPTVTACAPAGGESATASSEGRRDADTRPQVRRPPPGSAWVVFGIDTVVAEIARTPDERAEGLMYRDDVPDGTGMLFIFDDSQIRSFWMANTYVPLDIAYMDSSYRIVDIVQMEPLVTDGYPSSGPAMFALEVRQGWFAEHGISEGASAQVVLGPQLKR